MKAINYWVLAATLLLFSACEENFDITEEEIIKPTTISLVKSNVEGDVYDIQGKAISNANVELIVEGSTVGQVLTDAKGHYKFDEQGISTSGTVLKVTASNKISNFQLILPYARTSNYYPIGLVDEEDNVSIEATGVISISASDFTFQTKVEDLNLTSTGKINVRTSYLNKEELKNFGPTSKVGLDESLWLEQVAILNIRISDESSENISLVEGRHIEVELNEQIDQADGLYVWHLDEANGKWMQGDQINTSGSSIKLNVEQLGLIAVGRELSRVTIKGYVKDENLQPIYKAKVTVSNDASVPVSVYSNSDGKYSFHYSSSAKATIQIEYDGHEVHNAEIAAAIDGIVDDVILNAESAIETTDNCLSLSAATETFTCTLTLFPDDFFKDDSNANGTDYKLTMDGREFLTPTREDALFNENAFSLTKTVQPYTLEYKNANGTIVQCSAELKIEDKTPPVAIVDNSFNFTLNGMSTGKLYAETINEQSYDSCSKVSLSVARVDKCTGGCVDSDYNDYVEFFDSEIGNSYDVVLSVTDEAGNVNTAIGKVIIKE